MRDVRGIHTMAIAGDLSFSRAVEASEAGSRRYLVIADLRDGRPGTPVQVQR